MVFGSRGPGWGGAFVDDASDADTPHRTRRAAARGEPRAERDGLAPGRPRALGGGRLAASVGADRFFFVVLPDESAVDAGFQRHRDVEADGQ